MALQLKHLRLCGCTCLRRALHVVSASQNSEKLKIEARPPGKITSDWIGPPDRDSRLRKIKFYKPQNETTTQRRYREMREDAQRWNQQFWARHNKNFYQKKEEYIQKVLEDTGPINLDGSPKRLTAEEMATFYKQFLDENYTVHTDYNREWYRKNLALLWPAFKVFIERMWTRPRGSL